MKRNNKCGRNVPVQRVSLKCTMQHVNTKLSKWGESFNIPKNLRKKDFDIVTITKDNYKEKKDEWLPYLKNDVLALACCMMLYNEMMINISGLNMQSSLTLPSLTFKSWINKKIYAYGYLTKMIVLQKNLIKCYR